MKPIQSNIDTNGHQNTIKNLVEVELIHQSGDNLNAQIAPQAPTLGQEQLLVENQQVRQSAVDESYYIALDEALTMMLNVVKTFAPTLLAEKDKYGNCIKFPMIRIDNKEVKKENGKQVFIESLGKYGYFEMKPEVVQGVGVKIQTQSTTCRLPSLEQERFNKFIQNYNTIINSAQIDPSGQILKTLQEKFPAEQIMEWMIDAFGYDANNMKSYSEKDRKDKEAKAMLKQMTDFAISNNQPNVQLPSPTTPQAPTSPMTPQTGTGTPTGSGLPI